MKRSLFLILASSLAGLVLAQDGLPDCAQPCVTTYLKEDLGTCSQFDIACICSNKLFLSSIACCLQSNCNAEDQNKATKFALNLCQANKVTDLPTAISGVCTSTSAAASSAHSGTTTPSSPVPTNHTGTSISATGATKTSISGSVPSATQTHLNTGTQNPFRMRSSILGSLAAAVMALL